MCVNVKARHCVCIYVYVRACERACVCVYVCVTCVDQESRELILLLHTMHMSIPSLFSRASDAFVLAVGYAYICVCVQGPTKPWPAS